MTNLDTQKISKEINDALMHRACVMRSGEYLSKYLIHYNRSVDAIRLLGRCSIHDISKIQNTEEFLRLASIVDEMSSMQNVNHVLSSDQQDAIRLHWNNNSHHPEHFENPNDMSDLDIMEMACDCHARSKQYKTNLLEYINSQQKIRFHFDVRHFHMLKRYCMILVDLTLLDDYSSILEDNYNIELDFKDSTMRMLERFDGSCYASGMSTERLYLKRRETPDFASIAYSINEREDNNKVGFLSLKFNGFLDFKIYEKFNEKEYLEEALSKFIEVSEMKKFYVNVKKEEIDVIEVLQRLGFIIGDTTEDTIIFKYVKLEKELKKVPIK